MSALQESEAANENSEKHECRACLQDCNTANYIFQTWFPGWNGMNNTIAEDLEKIANIQISELDEHSKFICQTCTDQLRQACQFICSVQENDNILKLRNAPEHNDTTQLGVWPKPIQIDRTIAYENYLDVDVKQEILSEDENNCDNLDEAYTNTDYDEQIQIKVEPEEIVAPNPNIFMNGSILHDANCREKTLHNGGANYNEQSLEASVKDEPLSDPEDPETAESVPGDLSLECMLCTKSFVSVTGLKAHVIAQHSYKTVRRKFGDSSPKKPPRDKHICAICKRSFLTTTDLMVHETCHNKDVCYGCNSKFDSFEKLTVHRKRCKALLSKEKTKPKTLDDVVRPLSVETVSNDALSELPVTRSDENVEALSCELCNEKFIDIYYMKTHHEIHHSKESLHQGFKTQPVPMEIPSLENIFNEDT